MGVGQVFKASAFFSDLPFNNTNLQLVIPAKRVNFTKIDEGGKVDLKKSKNCPFDCYYYFYDIKLDLPSGALLLR
jgi:hypothetical protein